MTSTASSARAMHQIVRCLVHFERLGFCSLRAGGPGPWLTPPSESCTNRRPRHAFASSSASSQETVAQNSWKPRANNLDHVQGLWLLNSELSEALEADRTHARTKLYDTLPGLLGRSSEREPIELSKDVLEDLTVCLRSFLCFVRHQCMHRCAVPLTCP